MTKRLPLLAILRYVRNSYKTRRRTICCTIYHFLASYAVRRIARDYKLAAFQLSIRASVSQGPNVPGILLGVRFLHFLADNDTRDVDPAIGPSVIIQVLIRARILGILIDKVIVYSKQIKFKRVVTRLMLELIRS